MVSAFEGTVAFRYLRARRQEGFVSVIAGFSLVGIALGVAALIIVMAVMNGFRHELLTRILGFTGHVTVYAHGGGLQDFDALATEVQGVAEVVAVTPVIDGQVLATSARGATSGVLVRGIRAEDLRRRALIAGNVRQGSLDAFGRQDGIMVGSRLAARLGLSVGDRLTLTSPRGTPTAFGTVPRMRAYPVIAVFEVGMYEYDNGFVLMPLAAAQTYFRLEDAVTGLEVMVADPARATAARRAIAQVAAGRARAVDWKQRNAQFFGALQVERNVMFVILTLIVLVAALNIISSLIMLVKDKGRDIAILRTMGATRGMIMRIFFLTGASIGVVGTLVGFVLGYLFADNIETIRRWLEGLTNTELFAAEIYFLSQLPAEIDWGEVAAVVVMALALSFLATLYPSWRAARLDPVEALRYE
ncbi:MAG: lipoprotein-releasing ABC transporter permease subunit [Alphaproteobacteria bacterium]